MPRDTSSDVSGEIPAVVVRPGGVLKGLFVAVGLVVLAAFWLVLGIVVLALTILVALLALVWFVVWLGSATVVNAYFRIRRRTYPAAFRFPLGPRRARLVLSDAVNSSIGPTLAAAARGTILFLGPLVFILRGFLGWKAWRVRRSQASIVDLPLSGSTLFRATLRALIDVGSHGGLFVDGYEESTLPYDDWLSSSFREISAFLAWWPHEELAVADYRVEEELPFPVTPDAETGASMDLQPSPDPRGFPGLASAVIRRRRIAGLRELYQSAREIDDMCDPNLDDSPDCGVIRIVRTVGTDRQPVWIVQIASTQSWHPRAGAAPNDLTADLHAVSGRESALLRGTLAAMSQARIPVDEPVLMTGFSLGGLVAAQIATGRYRAPGLTAGHRIRHLITAGSPIARFPIAEGVRVLSLEHRVDPVHRLDGRPRATDTDAAVPWVTVSAGPPLPINYSIGHTHHAPSYAETGQRFAVALDDPAARGYWSGSGEDPGVAAYFSGSQTITDFAVVRKGTPMPQPAVPVYVQRAAAGRTRGRLRAFLRRLDGVIAADVYISRSGFPTTKSWSADLLVADLHQAMTPARRRFTYEGLLAVAQAGGTVDLNLRVMARNQRGGYAAASLKRAKDAVLREDIDINGTVELALQPLRPDAETPASDAEAPVSIADATRTTFLYRSDPFEGSGQDVSAM